MNQAQYENMTPYDTEITGEKCNHCKEFYETGFNDAWIEFEEITMDFCSKQCKEEWKDEFDIDDDEIIDEG